MDRKFGRKKPHREHMMRNLVTSLILYERITTTDPRAKEVKKAIDRLITIAKKNDLASHRQIIGYVFDSNAAKKMTEVLIPRYTNQSSGFTRSFHLAPRLGDAAPMTILELIPPEQKSPIKEEKTKTVEKTKTITKTPSSKKTNK